MAAITFTNLPGNTDRVNLDSEQIRISVGWRCRPGSGGSVASAPGWAEVAFHAPMGPDGQLLLQAVAAAASHPEWTNKIGHEEQWAALDFTLDVPPGWGVKYECQRLAIDGYRLVPTPDGWEEVLRVRCYRVTRTRNAQNPLPLTMDDHAESSPTPPRPSP